ncbi:hypothetical protein GCM10027516_09230 [Niabella aquatica]
MSSRMGKDENCGIDNFNTIVIYFGVNILANPDLEGTIKNDPPYDYLPCW